MWTRLGAALAAAARHEGEVRVDPLQRLHTLDNLAALLRSPPPGAPRTLRDDRLQVCCTAAAYLLLC